MSIERGIQPTQFTTNGGERYPIMISPKAVQRFERTVNQSGAPDIDSARETFPKAQEFYRLTGLNRKQTEKILGQLETNLYEGTATQQVQASETLRSIGQAYEDLKQALPNWKKQ